MPGVPSQSENILATWIHLDAPEEESTYPQVGSRSSSTPFQNTYWRCVATFFATANRTNNGRVRSILFTNTTNLPVVDGLDIKCFLEELGVELKLLPFTYQPPVGYYPAWRNQFYILDIIKHLSTLDAERFIVLDSDCLVSAGLEPLYEEIDRQEVILLGENYDLEWSTNGLTCHQLKEVYEELDGKPMDHVPLYYDGELFAANKKGILRIVNDIDPIWEISLDRFRDGKLKFNEEAHFLSYLYHRNGYSPRETTKRVRRIWTQKPYVNTLASDLNVEVWHLPAEKTKGIREIFGGVRRRESWFWMGNDLTTWRATMGQLVGLGSKTPKKRVQDFANRVRARLKR